MQFFQWHKLFCLAGLFGTSATFAHLLTSSRRILDLFGFGEENNFTTALTRLVGLFCLHFETTPLLMFLPTKVLRCTHPRGSFLPLLHKVLTIKCLGVFSGWNMLPTSPPSKTIKKGSFPPHNKSSTSKNGRFFPQRLVAEGFEGLSSPFKKKTSNKGMEISPPVFWF